MENFSQIYSIIVASYGISGIVIAVLVSVSLAVEVYYYIGIYASIANFRLQKRRKILEVAPPVSVIVPIFTENTSYLADGLVRLLTQDYSQFELVIVYVGGDDNFYAELVQMRNIYPHLKTTQIDYSPQYPISTKMALNVGIKSAAYEHIIMTTSDATPASGRWLSLMAKGFVYGDIVLGYCGLEHKNGLMDHFFREYRLTDSMAWIASAIRCHPFGATRHNMGFTKTLYFSVRGFNHLNMNVGEDDLFISRIASSDNVAPVLSPRAMCIEKRWGGLSWWYNQTLYSRATRKFYKFRDKNFIAFELIMRLVFLSSVTYALIVMPYEYKLAAIITLLIRYFIVMFTMLRVSRRLGEQKIIARHFLFDIVEPFARIFIRLSLLKRNNKAWR